MRPSAAARDCFHRSTKTEGWIRGGEHSEVAKRRATLRFSNNLLRRHEPMDSNLSWGIALTLAVLGVCGAWFYWCGYADRTRQLRAFAKRTFLYAGVGFLVGLAILSSDLGTAPMGVIAFTACCGLLVYAAGWAVIASDDQSLVLLNLTGRALLLTDPALAPFYNLPAPQQEPATELPPNSAAHLLHRESGTRASRCAGRPNGRVHRGRSQLDRFRRLWIAGPTPGSSRTRRGTCGTLLRQCSSLLRVERPLGEGNPAAPGANVAGGLGAPKGSAAIAVWPIC